MSNDVIGLPEEWGFCGCANEPAIALLRDILRLMDEALSVDDIPKHIEARKQLAGGSAHWELFMHYIDKLGWSEHGGGINSPWLTDSGKAALKLLEGLDLDS